MTESYHVAMKVAALASLRAPSSHVRLTRARRQLVSYEQGRVHLVWPKGRVHVLRAEVNPKSFTITHFKVHLKQTQQTQLNCTRSTAYCVMSV